jgi:hypothetical protein
MSAVCSFSYGLSVANGTVSMGILDALVAKGVLTRQDASGILQNAIATLEPNRSINAAGEAIRIIRDSWLPEYQGQ